MPFTPFHLGPGAAFKAVGGARFSFIVFGGSQVLMDIEPLVGMLRGDPVLHGPTHTVLGALVIGVVAGIVGRPITEIVLKVLRIGHRPLTWSVSLVSGLVGPFSHIALDAIMHSDMHPLWPISMSNQLLGIVSLKVLHLGCLAAGVVGAIVIAVRAYLTRSRR